jgi:hypothetical protein
MLLRFLLLNGVQSDAKWKITKHYGCAMLASASMQVIEERGAQSNNNIKMMLLDWALINTMVVISDSINNEVPIN